MHRRLAQISPLNDVEMTWKHADRVKEGVHVSKSPLTQAPETQIFPFDWVRDVHVIKSPVALAPS